jgi:hypothetical protein
MTPEELMLRFSRILVNALDDPLSKDALKARELQKISDDTMAVLIDETKRAEEREKAESQKVK